MWRPKLNIRKTNSWFLRVQWVLNSWIQLCWEESCLKNRWQTGLVKKFTSFEFKVLFTTKMNTLEISWGTMCVCVFGEGYIVYIYVWVCVVYIVHICVWVQKHVCTCVYRTGQTLCAYMMFSPHFLSQGLLLKLEDTVMATLAGHWATRIFLSLPPVSAYRLNIGTEDLNLDPQTCTTSAS